MMGQTKDHHKRSVLRIKDTEQIENFARYTSLEQGSEK
jgi:hypothetical protein